MGKKKMRKAIKRLAKDLEEAREENRELIEGLKERVTEALEQQAEANRALAETLDEHLNSPVAPVGGAPEAGENSDREGDEGPEVTEAAERRADELGVDLEEVEGTGSGGRILVRDVEEAAG